MVNPITAELTCLAERVTMRVLLAITSRHQAIRPHQTGVTVKVTATAGTISAVAPKACLLNMASQSPGKECASLANASQVLTTTVSSASIEASGIG